MKSFSPPFLLQCGRKINGQNAFHFAPAQTSFKMHVVQNAPAVFLAAVILVHACRSPLPGIVFWALCCRLLPAPHTFLLADFLFFFRFGTQRYWNKLSMRCTFSYTDEKIKPRTFAFWTTKRSINLCCCSLPWNFYSFYLSLGKVAYEVLRCRFRFLSFSEVGSWALNTLLLNTNGYLG